MNHTKYDLALQQVESQMETGDDELLKTYELDVLLQKTQEEVVLQKLEIHRQKGDAQRSAIKSEIQQQITSLLAKVASIELTNAELNLDEQKQTNDSLKQELDQQKHKNGALQELLRDQQNQNDLLNKQFKLKSMELDDETENNQHLKKEISKQQNDIKSLKKEKSHQRNLSMELEAKAIELEQKCDTLQQQQSAKTIDYMLLKRQIKAKKEENSQLRQDVLDERKKFEKASGERDKNADDLYFEKYQKGIVQKVTSHIFFGKVPEKSNNCSTDQDKSISK